MKNESQQYQNCQKEKEVNLCPHLLELIVDTQEKEEDDICLDRIRQCSELNIEGV